MIYKQFQQSSEFFHDGIPFIMEGQVIFTEDPDQMGRVKVWIPALDGENIDIDAIPWAEYASPFFGFTVEYPAGGIPVENTSHAAYGFWAIPKIGATVYVFFLNANPNQRCYFASSLRLHRNRSLPAGRNFDKDGMPGPWGDAGDGTGKLEPIQPAFDNLRQQFQDKLNASQAITRGAYERQVAQAKTDKDGAEGYPAGAKNPRYLDPQTYCWVTPGRHAIIMQDHPKFARLRVKTAEGHQMIFDDANERIYISTAKGKSWIEMDLDGHIHVFSALSISFRAGEDINFYADRNINIEADKAFNVKANEDNIKMSTGKSMYVNTKEKFILSACQDIFMSSELSVNIKANTGMDLIGGSHITESAEVIYLNGGSGTGGGSSINDNQVCALIADSPSIVPGHEPWDRPPSPNPRGPNWKP
jgi:hypothetical protein